MEVAVDVIDVESKRFFSPLLAAATLGTHVWPTYLEERSPQHGRFRSPAAWRSHNEDLVCSVSGMRARADVPNEVAGIDVHLLEHPADVGVSSTRLVEAEVPQNAGDGC